MGLFDMIKSKLPSGTRNHASNGALSHFPVAAPGFAVVDIETTGLSPKRDRVIEIAVIQTDPLGRPQFEWTTRVNPQQPVRGTEIHGITDADVINCPTFPMIISHLIPLLQGRALVAHNARFDLPFLRSEFALANWAWPEAPNLCTLKSARHFLPWLHRHRLVDCCNACGINLDNAHSALGDARATAVLLQSFLDANYGTPPTQEMTELPYNAMYIQWPAFPGVETAHASIPRIERSAPRFAYAPRTAQSQTTQSLLAQISTSDILAEGVSENTIEYIELLLDSLADGLLTDEEKASLRETADGMGITEQETAQIHHAIAVRVAELAVEDGKVSTKERSELKALLTLLDFNESASSSYINAAKARRLHRLSADLLPLPATWNLGEPLRVGDSVVFTGCAEAQRVLLESMSTSRGVYVSGSVSKKTAMLVTDGSIASNKLAKAIELGTRLVTPAQFETLLEHLQPYEG